MKVFISYRREDTGFVTSQLYDALAQHFGHENVFRDVESIKLGMDFRKAIHDAIASSNALLAVIGDQWEFVTNENGLPRISDPDDYVRVEIEEALSAAKPVIPVLVNLTHPPRNDNLPSSLQQLPFLNGCVIRTGSRFRTDVDVLIKSLEILLSEGNVFNIGTDPFSIDRFYFGR